MPKDFVSHTKGFYKPELIIHFMEFFVYRKCKCFEKEIKENYDILYIEFGRFDFICEGKIKELKPGDVFIAKPFENYEVIGLSEQKSSKITIISFHQNLFENINTDKDFLRPFVDRQKGQFNVYRSNEFQNFSIHDLVNRLKLYEEKKLSLNMYTLGIGIFVSEICIAFDNKNGKISTENAEEYMVRVYDYITSNCFTNIKVTDVMKKFSVSRWYIDKVTKRFYGFNFSQTITDIRMWHAQKYMKENIELKEVARLCGYIEYTGFYRAYKKFFGISPMEDLKCFKANKYFTSHNWWIEKS